MQNSHGEDGAYTYAPQTAEEANDLFSKHLLEAANGLIARAINGVPEGAYPTLAEIDEGHIEDCAARYGLGFPLCTPRQACTVTETSERTVRRMCEQGKLQAVQVGSAWRINTASMLGKLRLA